MTETTLTPAMSRLPQVRAQYEAWWERRNAGPICYKIHGSPAADFSRVCTPWMPEGMSAEWSMWAHEMLFAYAIERALATGDETPIDEAIDYFEYYFDVTDTVLQGYPFYLIGLGPSSLAAMITNFARCHNHTVWVELDEPWGWDRILAIDDDTTTPYAELALRSARKLVARIQHKCVICPPDLCGPLDVLAAIRGNINLLTDLYDEPALVQEALMKIERLFYRWYEQYMAIIAPGNHDCYSLVMRYLSGKPVSLGVCDFSAMISPAMFGEFVLPSLQRQAAYFNGRFVFHLDGPGQICHVDQLCGIGGLHGIQWVSGAGNPLSDDPHWYPLIEKILDAGKRVYLTGGTLDGLRALFARFPRTEFFIPYCGADTTPASVAAFAREMGVEG